MKKNYKRIITIISILLTLISISCNLSLSETQEIPLESKGIIISGTIKTNGALPSELDNSPAANRSAFPDNPTSSVSYEVTATKAGISVPVRGNVSGLGTTYEIALPSGGIWTVSASKKLDGKVILFDSKKTDNLPDIATTISISFNLKPQSKGTGKINLPVNIDPQIKSISVVSEDSDWNGTATITETSASIKSDSIKSKSYEVDINFYSDEQKKDSSTLLYSCTQMINVFDNLTTDTWINSSDEPYLSNVGSTLTLRITNTLITEFVQNVIYVDGEANEPGCGTSIEPLKTVAAAAKELNKKNSGGMIFVRGTTTETETILIEKDISIKKWGDGTPVIKRASSGHRDHMIQATNAEVTIDGLEIDGNKVAIQNFCAGIYANNCKMTIKNSTIKNCYTNTSNSSNTGGGLYNTSNDESKILTLENTVISDCKAYSGGGIFNAQGKIIIKGDSKIGNSSATATANSASYSNYAKQFGGGIYNEGNIEVSGISSYITYNYADNAGGGIYNKGKFTFPGGHISYNCSEQGGGIHDQAGNDSEKGIKISGSFSYIEYNKASDTIGGGINIVGSTSGTSISGGYIRNNTAKTNGGGVCLSSDCTLTFTGGRISNNTCGNGSNGSGIYDNGTLKLSGGATVSTDNVIYLKDSKAITFTGNMNSSFSSTNPCAYVTPEKYSESFWYFGNNNQYNNENCPKIAFTDHNGTWTYDASDGYIHPSIYVKGSAAAGGNGSKSKPFKTLKQASDISLTNSYLQVKIYVSGTTSETESSEFGDGSNSIDVTICRDGSSGTATIRRDSSFTGSSMIEILSNATVTLENMTLDGNKILATASGAGIQNFGTLTLKNSTVKNCTTSSDEGGGIYCSDNSILWCTNTTISNNSAGKKGGGVFTNGSSTLFDGGSIEANSLTDANTKLGSGIYVSSGKIITVMGGFYVKCYGTGKNDIYLNSSCSIVVNSDLSPSSYDNNSIISYVTGSYTTAGTVYLTGTNVANNFQYFKVSEPSGKFIDANGKVADGYLVKSYSDISDMDLSDESKTMKIVATGSVSLSDIATKLKDTNTKSKIELDCSQLTTSTMGDFYNCKALVSIVLPPNVTRVETSSTTSGVFENCSNLKTVSVTSDSKLEAYGKYCFEGCSSLVSIAIPDTLKTIEAKAFGKTNVSSIPSALKNLSVTLPGTWNVANQGDYTNKTIGNILNANNLNFSNKWTRK